MDIEYKDVKKVETQGKLVKEIGYKPIGATVVGLVISVGLIVLRNKFSIILGLFFLILDLIVLFAVKDYKVMDIYENGVLIYDLENTSLVYFLPFDQISKWTVKRENGANDAVYFQLTSQAEIYKNTFQSAKAFRCLNSLIGEKEEMAIKSKEYGNKVDISFKNLFKRKKDKE